MSEDYCTPTSPDDYIRSIICPYCKKRASIELWNPTRFDDELVCKKCWDSLFWLKDGYLEKCSNAANIYEVQRWSIELRYKIQEFRTKQETR